MKTSRCQRKSLNEMRGMADVSWPARAYRIAPTLEPVAVGQCERPVLVTWVKRRPFGWIRKPLAKPVKCGGELVLVPFRRRIECVDCKRRAKHERLRLQIEKPPMTAALAFMSARSSVSDFASRMFRRKAG